MAILARGPLEMLDAAYFAMQQQCARLSQRG
jgi:hypothetical protein